MRLGQFSRKFEVKSTEVVELLSENFRTVNPHPNIKLKEEELLFLLKHFQANEKTSVFSNENAHFLQAPPSQPSEDSSHVTAGSFSNHEHNLEEHNELHIESKQDETPKKATEDHQPSVPKVISLEKEYKEQTKDVEIITTDKPKLEGLKVLGKIEIPETNGEKPKHNTKEVIIKGAKPNLETKRPKKKAQGQKLSLEEQRQREERLAWKRKQQEQKELKEKRRLHYEKQLAKKKEAQKPLKAKQQSTTKVKEDVPRKIPTTTVQSVKKSRIKRFWQWLNGAYDNI